MCRLLTHRLTTHRFAAVGWVVLIILAFGSVLAGCKHNNPEPPPPPLETMKSGEAIARAKARGETVISLLAQILAHPPGPAQAAHIAGSLSMATEILKLQQLDHEDAHVQLGREQQKVIQADAMWRKSYENLLVQKTEAEKDLAHEKSFWLGYKTRQWLAWIIGIACGLIGAWAAAGIIAVILSHSTMGTSSIAGWIFRNLNIFGIFSSFAYKKPTP